MHNDRGLERLELNPNADLLRLRKDVDDVARKIMHEQVYLNFPPVEELIIKGDVITSEAQGSKFRELIRSLNVIRPLKHGLSVLDGPMQLNFYIREYSGDSRPEISLGLTENEKSVILRERFKPKEYQLVRKTLDQYITKI